MHYTRLVDGRFAGVIDSGRRQWRSGRTKCEQPLTTTEPKVNTEACARRFSFSQQSFTHLVLNAPREDDAVVEAKHRRWTPFVGRTVDIGDALVLW